MAMLDLLTKVVLTLLHLGNYDMAQDNIFGILSNYNTNDNLPAILDAIRWKETGGEKNPLKAIGSSGEIGAFQLNPKHFHNFGFDVQKNITSGQAQDYWSSRNIASDLLKGMVKYRNYDLGQLLAGYNWGSGDVDKWIAEGGKFEDLPDGTQDYLTKVAQKLQEGYVDPLREKMKPQPKPNTMMASNDQGINQNYDNNKGDVSINFRGDAQIQNDQNPSFWSYLNPINAAQAAPPNITNTKIGTNNMANQMTFGERLRKGLAQPSDVENELKLWQQTYRGRDPDQLGNLGFTNTTGDIGANNSSIGMLSQDQMSKAYWDTPFTSYDSVNNQNEVTEADKKAYLKNAIDAGAFDHFNNKTSQGGGILSNTAQAATLGNNQSSSQLPPNPSMTRTNTALSSPSNSMMVSDGEMLMRMAGAGMGSLGKGSSAALGSALDKYGEIKDTNRLTALEIAKAQAEAGADDETLTQIGQLDETMYDMDRALGYLNKYNLTGFFTQYLGTTKDKLFGGKAGNTRQAARKLLEKLRVDDTLLRIAQTKGAISNKEMDLFLSPSPNQGDPEGVWINWIQDRQRALQRVRQRLSTGQTIAQGERASSNQVDKFGSGTTKTTPKGLTYTIN